MIYYMMYINNILLACTEYCYSDYIYMYIYVNYHKYIFPCSCAATLCFYLLHHLLSLSSAHGN